MHDYLSPINNLYRENLQKYGVNSKAVGWKDSTSQCLRFQILNRVFGDHDAYFSVNDYGSGYGAHLDHMRDSGYLVSTYNAYDINEEMLEQLSKSKKSSEFCQINTFRSAEISTVADFSVVSGTFNVMPDDNLLKWEENIKNQLLQLKEYSTKGFAFNLLSTYVDWKAEGLYYGDPLFWFNFCKENISKRVALHHDYELFEWTILCKFDEID